MLCLTTESLRMDNDVEQVALIIDFEGWGLKNRDHDLDKMMIDTIQNYYPERLGQCFLVNAPTVFKVAWAVVRPWLDKRTTSKVRKNFSCVGGKKKKYLLNYSFNSLAALRWPQ